MNKALVMATMVPIPEAIRSIENALTELQLVFGFSGGATLLVFVIWNVFLSIKATTLSERLARIEAHLQKPN